MNSFRKSIDDLVQGHIFVVSLVSLLLTGCCHQTPEVLTNPVTNITTTSAMSGGKVTDDHDCDIVARGVCWNTIPKPTLNDCLNKTEDGKGMGSFTSSITGLTEGNTYYVVAYATNKKRKTGYGQVQELKTSICPSATTTQASNPGLNSATLNGTVNANGENTTVTFEYGISTNYGSSITADQSPVTGSTTTNVSADITGLSSNTTYHFRIKAESSICTKTGEDQVFSTSQCPDAVTSQLSSSDVGLNTATLKGVVNARGLSTTVSFEYGTTTSYGYTVTASQSPATGNSDTYVTAAVTGLTPNTTYHFRVKAENALCTETGSDQIFHTLCNSPSATTVAATDPGSSTFTLNGSVNANNTSTTVTFEYGTTTGYGSTITASQSPITGSSSTPVSAGVTGLIPNNVYHFRVKAINCGGTVYGSDLTFTTDPVTVSDINNNVYNVVRIGSQVWMAENLKTNRLRTGLGLSNVTDNTDWINLTSSGYCWYDNDASTYKDTYGALYNWYTVATGYLCPTGWHVPTDGEWTTLENYLITNGFNYDGTTEGNKYAKALASTTLWQFSSNEGAVGNTDYPAKRNATGFTGVPGGYRDYLTGTFYIIGISGFMWSSTEYDATTAWYRAMRYSFNYVTGHYYNKNYGFSVRCVKD
jgi:uncharacterized protein (TIGR02145 family)